MKWGTIPAILLALVAAGGAAAQQPTVQQQFEAASAARDAQDWPRALALFEALEARTTAPRNLAVIRVRKGTVLVELGRLAEAAAAIRAALPGLPETDATLHEDRFLGLTTLGGIAEHDLDYPEALRQYRLAAAIPVADADRLLLQRGIVQTQLFSNAEAALRDADAALRLAAAAAPGNRSFEGQLHTLKGRALLNLGRFDEARTELETALRLLGNLTMRVDRADLLARSDLAIAALLSGNAADARRYLAYTGAGRFDRGSIVAGESNDLPQCGPEIAPDDVAVIEAFVGADGSVRNAMPIYASRQGPSAIAFARSVSQWSFDAQEVRPVPALFRSVVRVEVRCVVQPPARYAGNGDTELVRLAAADPAWQRTIAARAHRSADALRAEVAAQDRAAGPASGETLPLLLLLAAHDSLPHREHEAMYRRALPLAAEADAPPAVIAGIAIAIAREQWMQRDDRGSRDGPDHEAMLAFAEIRRSPQAAALVRLNRARHLFWQGDYDRALAIAAEVRATPEAGADGLIRTEALEIEAGVHAARRDPAAARAAFEAIGPGAARCGLPPRQRRLSASSNDFPNDALRWGFEGWAVSEISASADGDAVQSRTVIAYPPFVFGESARRITDRARFEPGYAADPAPCPIARRRVRFVLPD